MKILSLSTDRSICEPRSAARKRQETYADRLGEVTVVVCTRSSGGAQETHTGSLRVIPTNSSSALFYGFDAWRIMMSLAKPDVVSVQDPFETGLIGLIQSRIWGVPLHVQVHTDFYDSHFSRHSIANRIRRILVPFVIARATRIRVIAEKMADRLRGSGVRAPIRVLPIFVDIARYAHMTRIKHPRFMVDFLFIGRLESEKRPAIAVEAVAAARAAGHDAGLTVVGDGSLRAQLEAEVRARGLERYVDFVGWKDDVSPYLAQADAVLVPSQYEGYGLVIVEALAAGVPVIATDVGIAQEAGAIIASKKHFSKSVLEWIAQGPRKASLANYPYRDFNDYADQYADDIRSCVSGRV